MVGLVVQPSVQLLKEVRLFQSFQDKELDWILKAGQILKKEVHSTIVIEGELSWGLYLILDGIVGVYRQNKLSGETYDVGMHRAGTFFGELSLIDDNPRSATVTALSDCTLYYISKDKFMELLNQSADVKIRFYEACLKEIVNRLRDLTDNYVVSQYQLWKTAIKKEVA